MASLIFKRKAIPYGVKVDLDEIEKKLLCLGCELDVNQGDGAEELFVGTGSSAIVIAIRAKSGKIKISSSRPMIEGGLCLRLNLRPTNHEATELYNRGNEISTRVWNNERLFPSELRNGDIPLSRFPGNEAWKKDNRISISYRGCCDLEEIEYGNNVLTALRVATSSVIAYFRLTILSPGISHKDIYPGNMVVDMLPVKKLIIGSHSEEVVPWVRIIDFDTGSQDSTGGRSWWNRNRNFPSTYRRMQTDVDCACGNALFAFFQCLSGDGIDIARLILESSENDGETIDSAKLMYKLNEKFESTIEEIENACTPHEREMVQLFFSEISSMLGFGAARRKTTMKLFSIYFQSIDATSEYWSVSNWMQDFDNMILATADVRDCLKSVYVFPLMPLEFAILHSIFVVGSMGYALPALINILICCAFVTPPGWKRHPFRKSYKWGNLYLAAYYTFFVSLDVMAMDDKFFIFFLSFILGSVPIAFALMLFHRDTYYTLASLGIVVGTVYCIDAISGPLTAYTMPLVVLLFAINSYRFQNRRANESSVHLARGNVDYRHTSQNDLNEIYMARSKNPFTRAGAWLFIAVCNIPIQIWLLPRNVRMHYHMSPSFIFKFHAINGFPTTIAWANAYIEWSACCVVRLIRGIYSRISGRRDSFDVMMPTRNLARATYNFEEDRKPNGIEGELD